MAILNFFFVPPSISSHLHYLHPLLTTTSSTLLRNPNQLRENRCSEPRNRIPALRDRKARGITSTTDALRDIGKGLVTLTVYLWI
jgi:hypothetical protein